MKKYSPTTPSRRHMTNVDFPLYRGKPVKRLLKTVKSSAGRNSRGRITVRHQGGGHKKRYRQIDFLQNKLNVPAVVETIEYDPYRTAFIARVKYADGDRRYILASKNMKQGDTTMTAPSAELKEGNRIQLKNVPVGYAVHNIELSPGKGGQIVRSAGASVEVLAHEGKYANLRLPSGEIRKVLSEGYASLGQVSNVDNSLMVIGKAGRSRHLGVRPTVRGSAMNPVDHPYGGGEGRAKRGTKRPKTMWGKVTGGRKTRKKNARSNPLIVSRRK